MSDGPVQLTRFFVRSQYSISFRRLRRFEHTTQARSDYEVIFLLSGNLAFEIDGTAGALHPATALLLNPATIFKFAARNFEALTLSIAPALVLDYAARSHLVGVSLTVVFDGGSLGEDERLFRHASDLARELTTPEPGQEIVIAALVEQIVMQLLRHHSTMRHSGELELSRVGLIDRRIRRAVELMHSQVDQDLSLKEIAAASFSSPYHFLRLFKKITGVTPHAYHTNLRMARAQALLAEADLSVSEISSLVGYSSPSHFTKAFRQASGLTPRSFREALVGR